MNTFRWIIFIPAGLVLGIIFSFPISLFYSVWNLDNIFFTSVVKNSFSMYFTILCMAWISPSTFSISRFKIFVSILFGAILSLTTIALLGGKTEMLFWEHSGEVTGLMLGYLAAMQWDKNSLRVLLADTKGAFPYNSYNKSTD